MSETVAFKPESLEQVHKIIARYPESVTPEAIHRFTHKLKSEPIGNDYHFLFCPTKEPEFDFEIISVKDIEDVTIEVLQKKLFTLADNV